MLGKLKKIGICGHIAVAEQAADGQTIKTRIFTDEIINQIGKEQVVLLDTYNYKRKLLLSLVKLVKMFFQCENVLMFPAQNGLLVFSPLFIVLKNVFKRKIHYVVIGGWLPERIKKYKWLCKLLKYFDGIYVETEIMKKELERENFQNTYVVPNCKKLKIISEKDSIFEEDFREPYQVCIFSRILKEKGIEDAIKVVQSINKKNNKVIYELDLYGAIDKEYELEFTKIIEKLPHYIKYKGVIEMEKSVEILKKYFVLLFPTHYKTEGVPGTIIDAYCAGIPVVASRWESFDDVVEDYVTGIGYEFGNVKELEEILEKLLIKTDDIKAMKKNCVKKASSFTAEYVVKDFLKKLIRVNS